MKKITEKPRQWAENIAALIDASDSSLSDIAFEAKITQTHLKNILNGKLRHCRVDTVARLARVLNCSLSCIYYCKTIDNVVAKDSKKREYQRYGY